MAQEASADEHLDNVETSTTKETKRHTAISTIRNTAAVIVLYDCTAGQRHSTYSPKRTRHT